MVRTNRAVLSVDIGGTAIKGTAYDRDFTELARSNRATPVIDGVEAVVSEVESVVKDLRAQLDASDEQTEIVGIGAICPGIVDAVAGIARYSANIGWRELPLRRLLSDATGLPVAIDHDVRTAGLAELRLGAARASTDSLYLQIGTGIAAAVIVDGRVVTGSAGMSGEIGHLPVMPDGELCACGQRGCTEAYASAAALARRYQTIQGAPVTAEAVLARAAVGEALASSVWNEAVTALGRALVSYTLLMDPDLIVFGGGLSLAGDTLLLPVAKSLQSGLAFRRPPRLVIGIFGADAGRVGAGLIGWEAAGGDR
ncbi:MAG: glucokinase [Pseudonocardiales bacterium]|jgi:glucokinase|nr:glucokinase [Pseudonocardiales bacterium]